MTHLPTTINVVLFANISGAISGSYLLVLVFYLLRASLIVQQAFMAICNVCNMLLDVVIFASYVRLVEEHCAFASFYCC